MFLRIINRICAKNTLNYDRVYKEDYRHEYEDLDINVELSSSFDTISKVRVELPPPPTYLCIGFSYLRNLCF